MHLVKQISPFTCGLACIESISTDAKKPITQKKILEQYEEILRRDLANHKDFGSTPSLKLQEILKDLGFGSFHGQHFNRQIVENCKIHHKYVLFFVYNPKGDHAYRFDSVNPDGKFKVMNPDSGDFDNLDFDKDLVAKNFSIMLID